MEITRKEFLASLSATLAPGAVSGQARAASQKLNVVILLSDQHRSDLLSCAGNGLVPTPNIDRIAAAGVRFTNAYCPYPECIPSRMSFLTGQYSHTHGVASSGRLDWRRRTIAHTFRDQGYLTGLIGKMHFLDGNNHGFDFRLGFNDWLMYLGPKVRLYANEIASYPGYLERVYDTGSGLPDVAGLWEGSSPWVGNVKAKTSLASDLSPEEQFDAFVARESSKFIRRYKDEPFFLVSGFLKPHAPFYPPEGFADEVYPPDQIELPPVGEITNYPKHVRTLISIYKSYGEERLRQIRAGYLGNLRFVDTCVGTVYQSLAELGLLDRTIVIYTSDHGEMGGEHGLIQKFVFFEPSVGVPLIVSYPKALPEGRVCRALTEYMGIYPTLCDLVGIPTPKDLDTQSFADRLRDPDSQGPSAVFAEYGLARSPRYMIRTHRHKYNFNNKERAELYDLEQDPGEFQNRADDPSMGAVRRRLHDQLFAWHNPERDPFQATDVPHP